MRVSFRTRALPRAAGSREEAARHWGPWVGRRYRRAIDALYALDRWEDIYRLRQWRVHKLRGARSERHALELGRRARLELRVMDERTVRIEEVSQHYGD